VEDPETGQLVPIWSRAKKSSGRAEVIARHAHSRGWTIGQTAQNLAASLTHGLVAGTTEEIADHFEEWFEAGAADGFAIQSPMWIEGFRDVARHVVPELVRRGLFDPDPAGATLRARLRTRA
jgi:alkanesulfonate monooxygenase SsuD/methylene tetrahydromethanopterin reductase-like flavin-dependent oxidoreductase (luciferase family)